MSNDTIYKRIISWLWWKTTNIMAKNGYGEIWMKRQVEKAFALIRIERLSDSAAKGSE